MGLISFLMIGVNAIFWAFGGTLLGLGIWMAVDPNAFDGLDASGMDDAMWAAMVYTMIGVGAFVFLVGFLGCCGAKRGGEGKSNILLKIYVGLVSLVIAAEIVVIILTAIFWSNIDDSVAEQMFTDVHTEYKGTYENDFVSVSWNKMQYKWKCCGSYNFTDYKDSYFANNTDFPVPYTCCVYKSGESYDQRGSIVNETACMIEAKNYLYDPSETYTNLNARGCYNELSNFFERNSAIIIGVMCGLFGLQLIGLLFSCILMNKK